MAVFDGSDAEGLHERSTHGLGSAVSGRAGDLGDTVRGVLEQAARGFQTYAIDVATDVRLSNDANVV